MPDGRSAVLANTGREHTAPSALEEPGRIRLLHRVQVPQRADVNPRSDRAMVTIVRPVGLPLAMIALSWPVNDRSRAQ
jgi:hypothetical protein